VTRKEIAISLGVALCLSVLTSYAQWQTPPHETANEVEKIVGQYCKMDAEGRWLGPAHRVETNDFFTEFRSEGVTDADVIVLEKYVVSDPHEDHGPNGYLDYPVRVDYFEWGSVDSFLHFRWGAWGAGKQGAVWGKPGKETIYASVYPTEETVNWEKIGEQEKGNENSLPWSMRLAPMHYINVDTAIRYVTQMHDSSNDPLIRYNASRTLTILASIAAGTLPPTPVARSATESSQSVVKRFVDLESGGMGLTLGGWSQLAGFFAETPKPQLDIIDVADIVGVGSTDITKDKADAGISTNPLGHFDSSLRLTDYPEMRLVRGGASACYGDYVFGFSLQVIDKHWNIAPDGTVKAAPGPPTWRIRESSQKPLITLATAIRYVTTMRSKTTDPVIRSNADRTLAILNLYRQNRPLPDDMVSANSDGCS
jgi:hypothetical protein